MALPVFFDVARGLFDVVVEIVVEFFRRFFALRKIVLLERVLVGVFGYSHQFQICHTAILSRFRAVRKRFRALSLFKTYSLYPLFLRFVGVFVSVCADFLIFAAFNEKKFSINFSKPIDRGGGVCYNLVKRLSSQPKKLSAAYIDLNIIFIRRYNDEKSAKSSCGGIVFGYWYMRVDGMRR